MALSPAISLKQIPGIGPVTIRTFFRLGIVTIFDLLMHFPFRHEDWSMVKKIAQVRIGEQTTIRCQVLMIENRRTPKKQRMLTEALLRDDSGTIKAVWFNQSYLPKILPRGSWVYLAGTLESGPFGVHLVNPTFEPITEDNESIHVGRLVPIYHTTGNLTSRRIRSLVNEVLTAADELPEWLPKKILSEHSFLDHRTAIRSIHFPKSNTELSAARDRLSFEELFLAQLTGARARAALDAVTAPAIPIATKLLAEFTTKLPFALTGDQRRSAWEIVQDLARARPMNRLLEGDVGSGKTVVAAMAILNAHASQYQTLYLAPTEILANQHSATLTKLLMPFGITVGLLTAGTQRINGNEIDRRGLENEANAGNINLLIGTHTLLQNKVRLPNLGFVIVDEQHRFGVKQRQALRKATDTDSVVPHLLSMTATPIPRTLALCAYGDLDRSMLREMPAGREPVATTVAGAASRAKTYESIRKELVAGRQAFVICPLVSPSDTLGVRSVTKEAEVLQKIFPEFKVGCVHGKLKPHDKQDAMSAFSRGEIHLLVATAVVEVGVDIPNATMMIIEGAERFGLAQLHQFRGRIGRGGGASHCFLFSETDTQQSHQRLTLFSKTHDGFSLAEYDLALRGPGEVFGTTQSGFPEFQVADMHDLNAIERARIAAANIIQKDPTLESFPLLRERLNQHLATIHFE